MEPSSRVLRRPVKIALLEKQEKEVSYGWKTCQLFSYILVIISGIASALAVGNVQKMFIDQCILYADLVVKVDNYTISVVGPSPNGPASKWGDITTCNFCQFFPVASVIFGAIWATFFIMCGRGNNSRSRSLPQPWRIVPPALVFNLVFVILCAVNTAFVFDGFNFFCTSMTAQVNITSCEELIGYQWRQYPDAENFYDDLVIAETGTAIGLFGWLMGFVVLLIRVLSHADFLAVVRPMNPSTIMSSQATASTAVSPIASERGFLNSTPHSSYEADPLLLVNTSVENQTPQRLES